MRDDFAVFILTHGRANNMFTLESLHKSGYTGRWYMLIDDEDKQREDYYRLFGRDNVIVFNKSETAKNMDECDIPRDRRSVVYARNATFDIATKMGLRYFMQLDDDYTNFRTRYEKDNALYSVYIKDFDSVIDALIEFLERTKAHSVCFAQSGDFIGGAGCNMRKKVLHRKAMNSFLCSTERAFKFIGRINEDVNTYVLEGSRGKLFFTVSDLCLDQHQTQKVGGGMTELYLSNGTYVKSFYTVMTSPSSVKIHAMGDTHFRIHHRVDWERAVPKIIRQEYKKIQQDKNMKKRFSDIQVGDIVYYVHPRHDYFEICDLELVEKKSDSEYKLHRKIATDYVEYNMEINTERIYTSSVYGKNKPFALFADKEEFLNCLKSLNQMIKEKITYYERVKR